MAIGFGIKHAASAFPGYDANRTQARYVAFGFAKRFGNSHIFAALSPNTSGLHVLCLNNGYPDKKSLNDINSVLPSTLST